MPAEPLAEKPFWLVIGSQDFNLIISTFSKPYDDINDVIGQCIAIEAIFTYPLSRSYTEKDIK